MIGPSTHVFENKKIHPISNGNRTEWSPFRSVIIRVIKKIERSRRGSPICLIMSMITDRIRRSSKFCYQLIITLTKFMIYKALF